jgi:hypothetical protein
MRVQQGPRVVAELAPVAPGAEAEALPAVRWAVAPEGRALAVTALEVAPPVAHRVVAGAVV